MNPRSANVKCSDAARGPEGPQFPMHGDAASARGLARTAVHGKAFQRWRCTSLLPWHAKFCARALGIVVSLACSCYTVLSNSTESTLSC
jgi:hypothetical protein